jgi:hypothetical protein
VKQKKKAKIGFVIYIAAKKKMLFYIYDVIVKQKKKALLITTKQRLGNKTMVEGHQETMLRYDTTRDQHSSIVVTYRDQQAYRHT